MQPQPLPPLEYLNEALAYDPTSPSGLRWKERPPTHFTTTRGWKIFLSRDAGDWAGHVCTPQNAPPYYAVKINQVKYYAHRIVWFLCTGEDPAGKEIDHKDRAATNNLIENLRTATRPQNASNKTIQKNNKSGVRGVTWCRRTQRWMAQIGHNGRNLFIGRYNEIEDAKKARESASARLHAEFAGRLTLP